MKKKKEKRKSNKNNSIDRCNEIIQFQNEKEEMEKQCQKYGFRLYYGSLYMDKHETIGSAKKQIDEVAKHIPSHIKRPVFLFDIVATSGQIRKGLAHENARILWKHLTEKHPSIIDKYIGITDEEDKRVCRDTFVCRNRYGNLIEQVDNIHLFFMVTEEDCYLFLNERKKINAIELQACEFCKENETIPKIFLKCAACSSNDKKTFYCSKECQIKHWPEHKKKCKI